MLSIKSVYIYPRIITSVKLLVPITILSSFELAKVALKLENPGTNISTAHKANTTALSLNLAFLETFFIFSAGCNPSEVIACSNLASMKSIAKARIDAGIAPNKTSPGFLEFNPKFINHPRPPAPAKAA